MYFEFLAFLKESSHCMFDFDDAMWFASGK
jgi:hypothetical protein